MIIIDEILEDINESEKIMMEEGVDNTIDSLK
jgi:hypothetical protein